MHMVHIKNIAEKYDAQQIFEDVVCHTVREDSRGYQTLIANIIKSIIESEWIPDAGVFHRSEFKRRAGYIMEFAARKMIEKREKKIALFQQIEMLRQSTLHDGYTTILPNISQSKYTMDRNTDELSREWGLLDGLCRANILKMIKED